MFRAGEPDRWVGAATDLILGEAPEPVTDAIGQLVDPFAAEEIKEDALADVAEIVVHELRNLLLRLELAADREISDYPSSKTCRTAGDLKNFADALEALAAVSRGARLREIQLADVVASAAELPQGTLWPVVVDLITGLVVVADGGLLRAAVANCVRNALEASEEAPYKTQPVVITGGRTDRDAWVAIHDDGVGLPEYAANLLEPHHSSKSGPGHFGLGLTIASRAMRAMGGSVRLENRRPRGVTCELRWPQDARQ